MSGGWLGGGCSAFLASQLILGREHFGTATPAHLPASPVTLGRRPVQEKDTTNGIFSLFGYGLSVTMYPYLKLLMRIPGSGLSRINCSELSLVPQHQYPAPHLSPLWAACTRIQMLTTVVELSDPEVKAVECPIIPKVIRFQSFLAPPSEKRAYLSHVWPKASGGSEGWPLRLPPSCKRNHLSSTLAQR